MIDIYFDMLIETHRTAKMIEELVKKYGRINSVKCNYMQMAILYVLASKKDGQASPRDFGNRLEMIANNNHYNLHNLVKEGYADLIEGRNIGMDSRIVVYKITEKGKDLYIDMSSYIEKKINKALKDMNLKEDILANYLNNLYLIQNITQQITIR